MAHAAEADGTRNPEVIPWIRTHRFALIPAVTTLCLSLIAIGAKPLSDDEHCTWWAIQLSTEGFFRLLKNVDAVLAPYYFLLRLWVALFGDSEIALRLPSSLAMALSAWLVAKLGQRLHDSRMGLFAGLFFAVIPSVTRYAHDARPYAFAVAATTGSTLLLFRALEDRASVPRWGTYAVSLGLAGFMHLVSLGVLFGHLMLVFTLRKGGSWRPFRDETFLRWVLAVAAGCACVVPVALVGAAQSGQLRHIPLPPGGPLSLVSTLPLAPGVGVTLLLAMLLGSFVPRARSKHLAMLLVWAFLPPLLLVATYDVLHVFRPRYLLFTLPAWSLLAALSSRQAMLSHRWLRHSAVLILALLLTTGLPKHIQLSDGSDDGNAAYRLAAEALRTDASLNDGIVFGGEPRVRYHLRQGIAYAMRGKIPLRDFFVKTSASDLGQFSPVECQRPERCLPDSIERVWLFTSGSPRNLHAGLPAKQAELLRGRFRVGSVRTFGKLTLARLDRNRASASRRGTPNAE